MVVVKFPMAVAQGTMVGPMLSTTIEALFVSALVFPIHAVMKLPMPRVIAGVLSPPVYEIAKISTEQ